MAAKKKKAAKAGTGVVAAGVAARNNPYVRKLIEDQELRENLRTAYGSTLKAYGRVNGKAPQKALENKKLQKDLKEAAVSFKSAADTLRSSKKRKRGRRGKGVLGLALVGGVVALVASEDLRKKLLDALFGAEEEFEYSSTTTPSPSSQAPVGA